MNFVFEFGLVLWALSLLLLAVGTGDAILKRLQRRKKQFQQSYSSEPISILKPICGTEDGLEENLESFFNLEYPKYELILCIADHRDKAVQIVRQLLKKHPNTDASLNIGDIRIGENPKINNLFLAYRNCKYSNVLISDSNVRVSPDFLSKMIVDLNPGVGLVTGVLTGLGAQSFSSQLEANYLNGFLFRWMHLSQILKNPLIMGKSMLFKKRTLSALGGIDSLKMFIAEDFAAGSLFRKAGLKIVSTTFHVPQYLGKLSFQHFWMRHIRWGRIRRSCAFFLFLMEPFSSALISGMIGAIGVAHYTDFSFYSVLSLHLFSWFFCDVILLLLSGEKLSIKYPFTWFVFEVLSFPIWIHTLCGNHIQWRGNPLRLCKGGRIVMKRD